MQPHDRYREINTAFSADFPREPSMRSRMVFRGFKSTQLAREPESGCDELGFPKFTDH